MQQQHQMQLRMQQQQQQRQMMMLHQVAPQGWLSVPSSQAMTAPPLAPGGGGGGVPMWAAAGAPDSPFSPGQVVALKRQKSRDFSWGFST
jgi:hypothetical protein